MKTTLPVAALAAFLCTACDESGIDTPSGALSCGGDNLLQNPAFDTNPAGAAPPWMSSQHAGEKSFELRYKDGVASIVKIATQPWFQLVQSVPVGDLRGKRLRYSAELKLDLTEEGVTHGFNVGGGLTVTLRGDPDPVMGGDRLLYSEQFEHEPHIGTTDWVSVSTDIDVPANASSLRLGFAQYANGGMEIRQPALYLCQAD
ncbi:hypothetical protein [Parahaliea mediterranea]|uniref:hypothetical protein n=1 Tax=Parahaliea mediterranea TaxID=651086 RepID=UPI000E2E5FAF|nr:hypothetical protein [Parahaliea mediterranea]